MKNPFESWFKKGDEISKKADEEAKTEAGLEAVSEEAKEKETWDVEGGKQREMQAAEASISPENFGEIVDRAIARLKISDERAQELAGKVKADNEIMERLTKMAVEQGEGGEKPTEEVLEDLVVDHFEKAFADKAKINVENVG